MHVDWGAVATIAAVVISLVGGVLIDRFFRDRPRLTAYLSHASSITTRPAGAAEFRVHTHTVVVKNSGRKPATKLRLGHNVLPDFSVYPDVQHEVEKLPGGGSEIVFPTLGPKEEVNVSYLYFPPMTWHAVNTHFKSEEGPARLLTVFPTPRAADVGCPASHYSDCGWRDRHVLRRLRSRAVGGLAVGFQKAAKSGSRGASKVFRD